MGECTVSREVVGVDQGDRWSHLCVLDEHADVLGRERIRTTPEAYRERFEAWGERRVVLEVGSQSPWSSRLLKELGHEVIVANPRRVKLIANAERKTDRIDAEVLARLGRIDPSLLAPIEHGAESFQRDRALLRTREALVRNRTRLILQMRGMAKALGARLPSSSAPAFAPRVRESVAEPLWPGMNEALDTMDDLTTRIRALNREVERACRDRHPATIRLRQVTGVGPIASLAYVLTVEDPSRFSKSREVGPFFGLVPRERSSGSIHPQLSVPTRGDAMARRCLVQSAHYILSSYGPDCDLKRFGQARLMQGGKGTRKRAVVAVARKLAVLLHRLWVTGEDYVPLREEGGAA